ncbi:hypothetical protein ACIA5D_16020 [Actinoplanes sp. NPDC051513]|uniref:hypothetical protein n=1 Tax=Actinoplanes sp. NPDC051513 TaxID=3363908 RepID=UPI0037BAA3AC
MNFQDLFVALAADQEFLILPNGRYFTLDRPEFRRLRDLIAEARALHDAPAGVLRIGRFQADVWDELAEVSEVSGHAAVWQKAVQELQGRKAELFSSVLDGGEFATAALTADDIRSLLD